MEKRESILLIPVLSVGYLVKQLRDKYDSSSLRGIPPHITILFPFKNPNEINEGDINKLRLLFPGVYGFSFALQRISTFSGVVFLEPTEREKFIHLTNEIVRIFPEYPPYKGKFTEINPHLTIGHELGDKFDQALIETRRKIKDKLPISVKSQEVWLMESENGTWAVREKFPLLI